MRRNIILTIGTFWLGLYDICFLGIILFLFVSPLDPPVELFIRLFIVHLANCLLLIGFLMFYLHHACKNQDLTTEQKARWIVALLSTGPFAMPIYWSRYIRANRT